MHNATNVREDTGEPGTNVMLVSVTQSVHSVISATRMGSARAESAVSPAANVIITILTLSDLEAFVNLKQILEGISVGRLTQKLDVANV
ncbi:hypothetical protein Ddc_15290 [Ditylenchus destructor]|nr:hypothetical protein Ddc_15290 [Ditylenchus destructor]